MENNLDIIKELRELLELSIKKVISIVPQKYNSNLMNNLNTLEFDTEFDFSNSPSNINPSQCNYCLYIVHENKIIITKEYYNSIKKAYPNDYKEMLLYSIEHELLHMASAYYNKETNEIHSGFDSKDKLPEERTLTEGLTDYLALAS